MVHSSTGSIGTSIPYRSRALTHEVGHYLGLSHTWGNNNDPGLASNCDLDDAIGDTPNCIGLDHCDLAANTCTESTNPGNDWKPDEHPTVFTMTMKGNTLVDISPRSQAPGYPLYQRDEQRDSNKAPMKKVRSFIPNTWPHKY